MVTSLWGRESGFSCKMADELEVLWSKLTFTEEEGKDIALGSNSTKVAREIKKNAYHFFGSFEKEHENVVETKQGTANL